MPVLSAQYTTNVVWCRVRRGLTFVPNKIQYFMTKLFVLTAFMLVMNTDIFAQGNKEKLVDLIETSSGWLPSYTAKKLFTINLSPTVWESVLAAPSQPRGRDSFRRLAQSLVDFSDKAGIHRSMRNAALLFRAIKPKSGNPPAKSRLTGWPAN